METSAQIALVIATIAHVRQLWPSIDGKWVLLLALALSIAIVLAQYNGAPPSVPVLIARIVAVYLGTVGVPAFATYLVQKHADAVASRATTLPPTAAP